MKNALSKKNYKVYFMINYDMKGIGFLKEKKAILNNWTIKKNL